MPDLVLKRHDTYPPLEFVLSDADGPIDLTSATSVTVLLKGKTVLVTGVCDIDDAPNGVGHYDWIAGDTTISDTYEVEFQIAWPSSGIQTVPNASYNTVVIMDDLGP